MRCNDLIKELEELKVQDISEDYFKSYQKFSRRSIFLAGQANVLVRLLEILKKYQKQK